MPDLENGPLPEFIGKRVDPTYSKILQKRLKELLHTSNDSFPGCQPVSFETKHLNDIEREDYYVCEKSDGVRYLLFIVHSPKGPASFLYDRNRYWYYVPNLLFPIRGRDNEYLKDTLIDGELVLDTDEKKMLQQDVIQPFHMSLRNVTDISKLPPFSVELKKMERSYGLRLVFDQIPKLKHKSDGIIWTPVKYPYTLGTCEKLLKWKPPELNTVDFRIAARWSKEHKPIYSIEVLSHGVTYKFYDHFQPEPALATEWKSHLPDGRIAEFRYDSECEVTIVEQGYAPVVRKGGWRFVRFRDDKGTANDENAVKRILNSIRDGVTKEQLLACMDRVRAAWKAREKGLPMPPLLTPKPSFDSAQSSHATTSLPPTPTMSKSSHYFGRSGSKQGSISEESDYSGISAKRKASVTSITATKKEETEDSIEEGVEQKKMKPTIKNEALKMPTSLVPIQQNKITKDESIDTENDKSTKLLKDIDHGIPNVPKQEILKDEHTKEYLPKTKEPILDVKAAHHISSILSSAKPDSVTSSPTKTVDEKHDAHLNQTQTIQSKPQTSLAIAVDQKCQTPSSQMKQSVTTPDFSTSSTINLAKPLSVQQTTSQMKQVLLMPTTSHPQTVRRQQTTMHSPKKRQLDSITVERHSDDAPVKFASTSHQKKVFPSINGNSAEFETKRAMIFTPEKNSKKMSTPVPGITNSTSPSFSINSEIRGIQQEPLLGIDTIQSSNSKAKPIPQSPRDLSTKPKPPSSSNIHKLLTTSVEPVKSINNDRNSPKNTNGSDSRYNFSTFPPQKKEYTDLDPRLQHYYSLQPQPPYQTQHEPIQMSYHQQEQEQEQEKQQQQQQQHIQYLQKHIPKTSQAPVQFINFHAERRSHQGSAQNKDQFLIFQSESHNQSPAVEQRAKSYSSIWKTNNRSSNLRYEQQPISSYQSRQISQQTRQDKYSQQFGYEQQVAHQPSQAEKPKNSSIKSKLDFILN
ncbi:hypothetical protein G6F57_006460 [Rhizopus arrhizus]|uniref:mRNA guanylyltransferase n=1 Tax=Rhizopus oryzae TaxID=64495 RepID=A0A9P6X992_RHIOR|nr:hypothetical protein G6F30_003581 [Rhizopus arrhizus]KAG1411464.1 hypothetical protein G6F58_008540 [Rhizopus delemar]KAG0988267.1 hypothetical protein G6F29_001878 [Rhizopus arrhizus]KAG0993490.1 hypothetical protein G6F28_006643 [Rhizopus arrhizus]KAG1007328.1 hypothetical protein G6F27_007485 [Rhizopus arrhizus]